MSESRPPRRPVGGSRPSSAAPKKIAGRGVPAPPPGEETPEVTPVEQAPAPARAVPTRPVPTRPAPAAPPQPSEPPSGILTRSTTTVVLAAVLGVLLLGCLAAAGLAFRADDARWFGLGDRGGEASGAAWRYDAKKDFALPEHPIAVNYVDARNAADAATNAVLAILTVDWKTYDDHLEGVRTRMTESFYDEEYAATAADSREKFLASKAAYQFEVAGQSVVSATDTEVTALLFLNQYVTKGEGEDRVGPDVYQVRVLVTAVADGDEWLVDKLDAL